MLNSFCQSFLSPVKPGLSHTESTESIGPHPMLFSVFILPCELLRPAEAALAVRLIKQHGGGARHIKRRGKRVRRHRDGGEYVARVAQAAGKTLRLISNHEKRRAAKFQLVDIFLPVGMWCPPPESPDTAPADTQSSGARPVLRNGHSRNGKTSPSSRQSHPGHRGPRRARSIPGLYPQAVTGADERPQVAPVRGAVKQGQ